MKGLKYLVTITRREFTEQYTEFFQRHNVNTVMSTLCKGTATDTILDYFGLEKTDKIMFRMVLPELAADSVFKGLIYEMNISASGNGIAVSIPLDSIGGLSGMQYLVGNHSIERKEESKMCETKYALIITVVDKGNTDNVMDAARSVGARGGTVIKARGTGAEIAKFFGLSITEEKEMVYIVTGRKERDAIMHAIMEKAGLKTTAHGVVFSLPVDNVIGLQSIIDEA